MRNIGTDIKLSGVMFAEGFFKRVYALLVSTFDKCVVHAKQFLRVCKIMTTFCDNIMQNEC